MEKKIVIAGILVPNRADEAGKVQKVLTEYGDLILCRMGVSELAQGCKVTNGPQDGIINLTLNTTQAKMEEMEAELKRKVPEVTMKYLLLQ